MRFGRNDSKNRFGSVDHFSHQHGRAEPQSVVEVAADVICSCSCPILTLVRVVPTAVEGRSRRSVFLYAVSSLRRGRENRQGRAENYCDDEDFWHIYLP
jgi:hypothetical protein